ncbi:MAG: hypothetical protein ACKVQR_12485 [Aquabacterium sp.]
MVLLVSPLIQPPVRPLLLRSCGKVGLFGGFMVVLGAQAEQPPFIEAA